MSVVEREEHTANYLVPWLFRRVVENHFGDLFSGLGIKIRSYGP